MYDDVVVLTILSPIQEIEAPKKPAVRTADGVWPIIEKRGFNPWFLGNATQDPPTPQHGPYDIYSRVEMFKGTIGTQPRPCLHLGNHSFSDASFVGATVDHGTTRCRDQGQLLEEARKDLEVFKRAYYNAEREIHDLSESFEQEKQALNDEIRRLREHELYCRDGRLESNHYPEVLLAPLLTRDPAETIVYHVTQCQCQGRLLDEAKRDLEALKKAQYKAERDMYHLEERFEREMGAANHEIRHLRVRLLPPYPNPFRE